MSVLRRHLRAQKVMSINISIPWVIENLTASVIMNASDTAVTLRSGKIIFPCGVEKADGERTEIVLGNGYVVANQYNGNGSDYWCLFSGGFPFCGTGKSPHDPTGPTGKAALIECLRKSINLVGEWEKRDMEKTAMAAAYEQAVVFFRATENRAPAPIIVWKHEDIFICGPNSHNRIPGDYEVDGKHYRWHESASLASRHGWRVETVRGLKELGQKAQAFLAIDAFVNRYQNTITYKLRLADAKRWNDYTPEWDERTLICSWTEKLPNLLPYRDGESYDEHWRKFVELLSVWLGKSIKLMG